MLSTCELCQSSPFLNYFTEFLLSLNLYNNNVLITTKGKHINNNAFAAQVVMLAMPASAYIVLFRD